MPRRRQAERAGAGHAAHADSEDPGARADARLRHRRPPRADQQGRVPGQRRIALPGAAPPGARRADRRRVARHREQPAREVLHAHRAGPGEAASARPATGKCRRPRSPGFSRRRWESCDVARSRASSAGFARCSGRLASSRSSTPSSATSSRPPIEQKMRGGHEPRGGRPRRAARAGQPRSGEGPRPRRRVGIASSKASGRTCATRSAACASRPASRPWRPHAGARHRRQHRHLQRDSGAAAASAAGSPRGRTRAAVSRPAGAAARECVLLPVRERARRAPRHLRRRVRLRGDDDDGRWAGTSEQVDGAWVTGEYYDTLGLRPLPAGS